MGYALRLIVAGAAAFLLQGCLVKTAVDVVTLPFTVASSGDDLATTSQSEYDQKRWREILQREERLGKLQRESCGPHGKQPKCMTHLPYSSARALGTAGLRARELA